MLYKGNYFINSDIVKSLSSQDTSIADTIKTLMDNEEDDCKVIKFNPEYFTDSTLLNESCISPLDSLDDDDDDDFVCRYSQKELDALKSDGVSNVQEDTVLSDYNENEYFLETSYVVTIDGFGTIRFAAHSTDFEPTFLSDDNDECYVHPLLTSIWQEYRECTPSTILSTLRRFGEEVEIL